MSQHLSPAAQAIVQAFDDRYELCGPFDDNWQELCLAAALEALADQVVPHEITWASPNERARHWPSAAEIAGQQGMACVVRREILAIAAELRGGANA